MLLKTIEVNGFKSFPNKKEIVINDGITGVVGPNGSGKSNIADALRWVLGEQSAKSLRGTNMQDVIFNGTQSRTKKGYCEVSLVFDNEDMRIDSEYTEIAVKRKMYRSGESEFSINGQSCRMKDILELFRDTGIGKEGYSIIGQGRIDEILTSKPSGRRKVFEEAAGIMKYRVRKEEAEKNLEKTAENILRIEDLIAELELQIGPLEVQMMEAKDFLSLRERLKTLEVGQFLYNYDRAKERIVKIEEQIREKEQEYADIEGEAEKLSQAAGGLREQVGRVQAEIDAHNAKMGDYSSETEKLKGMVSLTEEREKQHRQVVEQAGAKAEELTALAGENKEKLAKADAETEGLNTQLDVKYGEIAALKKELEAQAEKSGAAAPEAGEMRKKAEELRAALNECTLLAGGIDAKMETLGANRDAARLAAQAANEGVPALEAEIGELENNIREIDDADAKKRTEINALTEALFGLKTERRENGEKTAALSEERGRMETRLKLLCEMRETHEGMSGSVKALLGRAQDDARINRLIVGVLAELISVPEKVELAVETILGNALQNIVTKTDGDAKEIIDYLRKHSLGRVTFLPAKSLRVRHLEESERALLKMDGVLGVASEFVQCGEDVRPAVDFLLARTVIVQDMETAIKLMKKCGYSLRALTLDGDFIKPGGVMTGGSVKNTGTGLLSRKRLEEQLEGELLKSAEELEKLQQATQEIGTQIDEKSGGQQKLLDELKASGEVRARLSEALSGRKSTLLERQGNLQGRQDEIAGIDGEIRKLEEQKSAAEKEREEKQAALDVHMEELQKLEHLAEAARAKQAEMTAKLQEMELERAGISSRKNVLLNEASYLREEARRLEDALLGHRQGSEESAAELKKLAAQKRDLKEQLDDILVSVKNAGAMIEEQFTLRDKLNAEIEEISKKHGGIANIKNELIEQKYRFVTAKEKAEIGLETMQTKLWEDYGLTYKNALDGRQADFAPQAAAREIEEIRARMQEMGDVNPRAIEDYARVKERHDELCVQRDDLEHARADLGVVIAGLLDGMEKSFRAKFEQINSSFGRVFKELFGGGHAQVVLLEEEGGVMECGIEITAEPPGKKLQNLMLLSGGEKALTAIALLFAMLDINPSPVCLLDEIDAPLDDANVIRLCEYLKKMSGDLQFIIITHRKPTMAICDTLYGIAMQERGISDIVSVQLDS